MIKLRTWLHQLTYLAQDNATAMAIFNAKYFIPSDHPMARSDSGWHCKGQCFEKEEPRGIFCGNVDVENPSETKHRGIW